MSIQNPSLPLVPAGLHVGTAVFDDGQVLITATPIATGAACPACGEVTACMHDRRWRKIADLPWHDRAVLWRVQVRRFRCRCCPGRVFTEPLPALAGIKVQRSDRLAKAQTSMGTALDGEARVRTIVCDLERRCVIDLLPGRSSGPVARWLAAHPGVAVVSRDRAGPYADAARTGAPGAIQVVDRWHLLVCGEDTS